VTGAQIAELIRTLPDGLATVVGERGYRFSGGEKQRIAIARLLLKAPSIVILDEATAHLDSESEAAVQRALSVALAGRTALVIAHRLSTVREADALLVLDDGRVVERGTHDELVAAGGLYAELYRTQFAVADSPPVIVDDPEPVVAVAGPQPIVAVAGPEPIVAVAGLEPIVAVAGLEPIVAGVLEVATDDLMDSD
jgi:ATP-binding cassette subfamily B protein